MRTAFGSATPHDASTGTHSAGSSRTSSSSSQYLFLDSADRENLATKRDLAGHRDVVRDGAACQQGDQGGGDDHTGRGAILGYSTLRDMNVEVERLEDLGVDPELHRVGAHPGESCLGGLLHHIAQLSGKTEFAFTFVAGRLNVENVAAYSIHNTTPAFC